MMRTQMLDHANAALERGDIHDEPIRMYPRATSKTLSNM